MPKINLNRIARLVTEAEGGKVSLPIAQVKEVIRLYNEVLILLHMPSEVLAMLEKTGEAMQRREDT